MTYRAIIPLFISLFFFQLLHAQDLTAELKWSDTKLGLGGSSIYWLKVVAVGDGRACTCGNTSFSNGVDHAWLTVMYDSLGNVAWQNSTNSLGTQDLSTDCAIDSGGNVVAGGYFSTGFGQAVMVVVKYGPDGEELWQTICDVPTASALYDIMLDDDDNIYAVGNLRDTTATNHLTLMKLDGEGQVLWKNFYPADGNGSFAFSKGRILEDRIMVLSAKLQTGGSSYVMHQVDFSGQTISTHENSLEDDFFIHTTIDAQGNIYLGDQSRQYKVAKVAPAGDTLWYYELPVVDPMTGAVKARLLAIETDYEGNVYVTGPHHEDSTYKDAVTTKLDIDGNIVWSQRYSRPNVAFSDIPNDIVITNEYVFVAGLSYKDSTDYDYMLLIYSVDGEELLALNYDHNGNLGDQASSVAVDGNDVYLTGHTTSGILLDTTFILTQRYHIEGLISAISQQKLVPGVEIWPNPFTSYVQLDQTESPYLFNEFGLFTVSGRKMAGGAIAAQTERLDFPPGLSPGVYLLKLYSGQGAEMCKVLVKGG